MRRPTMGHHCAAPGCAARIGTTLLMCGPHWGRLPFLVRNDVTAAWKDIRMDDWRAACRRAVAWLDANPPRPPAVSAPRWSRLDLSHPEARRS